MIIVKDLIKVLEGFNPDLEISITDLNDISYQYQIVAERIKLASETLSLKDREVEEDFVEIKII